MEVSSLQRTELVQVAEAVAREKSIEIDEVLEALELAYARAGRAKYGAEHDIRAAIDRKSGEVKLARYREVVEELSEEGSQILLKDARVRDPEIAVGGFVVDELPPIDMGRIAAQSAKQVIVQKVREAERRRQFEEYKDRIGEVVNGTVKRVDYGNLTIDLGRAEGIMRRDQTIMQERPGTNERIRAYIADVREESRGPQIFLSRTHPQFMVRLFEQEVPEVYDGIIEIKAVARDPGSRAKIAVISKDPSIDPVGACVGLRGSRVKAVVQELRGEKIDIVPWSSDVATFIVNALAPAEVTKVVLDPSENRVDVVVPEDQQSKAIGMRGQNVRLASQLCGLDIDIMTEDEESERRQKEMQRHIDLFKEALGIDDMFAHLLASEGFTSIEEIAFVPTDELVSMQGIDEELAGDLREVARGYLAELEEAQESERKELGVSDEVAAIEGLTPAMLVTLGAKGVKTLDDFADLAGDELCILLSDVDVALADIDKLDQQALDAAAKQSKLSKDDADAMIMAARAHWFEGDAPAEESAPEEVANEEAATEEPAPGDATAEEKA